MLKRQSCIDESDSSSIDVPFEIPRQLKDIQEQSRPDFERAKRFILRMDEYLLTYDDDNDNETCNNDDISTNSNSLFDLSILTERLAFREILTADKKLPIVEKNLTEEENNDDDQTIDSFFRQTKYVYPMKDINQIKDFRKFEQALEQHRLNMFNRPLNRITMMTYLKFCLVFEIQRDENESCMRVFLHDIIFKFNLADFHLLCEIHMKKPTDKKIVIDKIVRNSHLNEIYSAELVLWSGDWVHQQEIELYVLMKIESLAFNKYMTLKFWDVAHLHVKNILHGASRVFLRELTPIIRPYKLLTRASHIGQVELEVINLNEKRQLFIRILRISYSSPSDRLGKMSETSVEVVLQSLFDIYDVKREKMNERTMSQKNRDDFHFYTPENVPFSDLAVDLVFHGKSSLISHPLVVGVLTLSKHTDWFPARKFWTDVEENPNMRLRNRFLFEGNIYD